ncbi:MAG: methylated-DNA--[protein]-cysteine S-methyltransferase [Nitrospirota bacterium]
MKRKRLDNNEFYDIFESHLGILYLIFISDTLVGISFKKPRGILLKQTKITSCVKKELAEYFRGLRTEFTCKTAFIEGTDFEKRVWNTIRQVPYAETRTYKWLANEIGKPQASRAVGQALSKNPVPVIFPCHRIIESDGSLGGYSSGTNIKRRLLEFEYYTRLSKS